MHRSGQQAFCPHSDAFHALTTGVVPAAANRVAALTAARFTARAQFHQAMSAQAALMHDRSVATLAAGADFYAATAVANMTGAS